MLFCEALSNIHPLLINIVLVIAFVAIFNGVLRWIFTWFADK